jgi:dTDP-4-dehydrorhamnose reductase
LQVTPLRILLTGASGQVGWELARSLMPLGVVMTPGRGECDLSQPGTLATLADAAKPDVMVNAAAYTAVDQAEKEVDVAMAVNAHAPGVLAQAARRHGALFVHYSTDYVFDGTKAGAYTESDATGPRSVYGRSKLAGEEAVRASGADYLIFRTSWVYAARGKNFVKTMLRLAAEREELRVVADQIGAPTWARLIADSTAFAVQQALAQRSRGSFASDTYNLTAAGETSWHGFAGAIIASAQARGVNLKCRNVVPITTADYPLPAQRPANSRLAGDKLASQFGLRMPAWEHALQLCLAEIIQ